MPIQKGRQSLPDPIGAAMRLFDESGLDGHSPQSIQRARECFGKLPALLERAWLALGTSALLCFTLPYPRFLNRSHLVFYWDGDVDWLAGIVLADLHLDDPPVWVTGDIDDDGKWEKSGDTLAAFLMAMFGLPGGLVGA